MKYKWKADFYHSYRNVQLMQLLIKLHCCIRLDLVVKKAASRSEDIYIYLWIPSHAFLSWEQCFYVWPAMLLLSLLLIFICFIWMQTETKIGYFVLGETLLRHESLFHCSFILIKWENIIFILVTHSQFVTKYQKYKMSGCWLQIYLK